MPALTRRAASMRLAGVMRLTAPSWSPAPQRPQLESDFLQRSISAFVSTGAWLLSGVAWATASAKWFAAPWPRTWALSAEQATREQIANRGIASFPGSIMLISPSVPAQRAKCIGKQVARMRTGAVRIHLVHERGLPPGEGSEAVTPDSNCFRLRSEDASHRASWATSSAQTPHDGVHVSRNIWGMESPSRKRRRSNEDRKSVV